MLPTSDLCALLSRAGSIIQHLHSRVQAACLHLPLLPGRLSIPGLASGLVGPDARMTFLKVAALFRVAVVKVATLLRVGRSCALEAVFSRA